VRLNEIQAAAQARDFDRAADLADAALATGLEHPMVLNLAALKREAEGRYDEAMAILGRAIAMNPQDIGARNAMGLVQARVERYADALATFDGVVALQPDQKVKHPHAPANRKTVAHISAKHRVYRRGETEHIARCEKNLDEFLGVPRIDEAKINVHCAVHAG